MDLDRLKQHAAEEAVKQVQPDTVVGLGTGSTAAHAVRAIARRMKREGFSITGVPTSKRTAALARELGIPLATLDEQPTLDLAIDGADEVAAGSLDLIKGAGGALLVEKLVECRARKLIVVADETKKVKRLGVKHPLPVEVVRFGWKTTAARVQALGGEPVLRKTDGGEPFVTDEGHYLLDCRFGAIAEPAQLAAALKGLAGVVEHGLFVRMAHEAILAGPSGLEILKRPDA